MAVDRLPEKNNTYFVGWDDELNGETYTVILGADYWNGKEFEVDEPDEAKVGAQPHWWLEEVEVKNISSNLLVSGNEVTFCTCGNPSKEGNCYFKGDEELIYECCDCGKQV